MESTEVWIILASSASIREKPKIVRPLEYIATAPPSTFPTIYPFWSQSIPSLTNSF